VKAVVTHIKVPVLQKLPGVTKKNTKKPWSVLLEAKSRLESRILQSKKWEVLTTTPRVVVVVVVVIISSLVIGFLSPGTSPLDPMLHPNTQPSNLRLQPFPYASDVPRTSVSLKSLLNTSLVFLLVLF